MLVGEVGEEYTANANERGGPVRAAGLSGGDFRRKIEPDGRTSSASESSSGVSTK